MNSFSSPPYITIGTKTGTLVIDLWESYLREPKLRKLIEKYQIKKHKCLDREHLPQQESNWQPCSRPSIDLKSLFDNDPEFRKVVEKYIDFHITN
jgi:hypothetical protein